IQQSTQNELILINNQSLEIQAIFDSLSNKTIQTNDGEKMGISLSELLNSTQLSCPSCHSYTIKAKDGYQQTVIWDDMQQGVLTMEKRVYFPHLAHAFWIRDVVEIEVK
ncbi:MAG: hypothetical protein QCI00_06225, partial [Candidatus Thermoplasmatota archaeon]|nr:hypothetical protein [Candidatus Thermoplasmatota archaeon]